MKNLFTYYKDGYCAQNIDFTKQRIQTKILALRKRHPHDYWFEA
jgi:hypothetical protein